MSERDILLVEDNHGDVRLIEEAFEDRELPGTIHAVHSGTEALDWMIQCGDFASAPRPDIVLVDLNLPGTSGHTILEGIKSDPDLKRIPTIVLTGSKSDAELIEAYEEYANACLIKPVDPDEFADLIQTFAEFWVSTAALPSVPGSDDDPLR